MAFECFKAISKPAVLLATASILLTALVGCFLDKSSQVEHANVSFDVSPDGNQIVFASATGDLFQLDLKTRKVIPLIQSTAIESSPSYSPDGKLVLYAAVPKETQSSHIFRIKSDATQNEQVTSDNEVFDSTPVISPDGSQIAFARAHKHRPYSMGGWTWDDWDVYVMDIDGSDVKRLTHNNYYGISGVVFSPSGKSILFAADNNRTASDLDTNIFEILADGSGSPKPGVPQPTAVGKYAAWATEPDFSPDGKTIAVISDRKSSFLYDVILIAADFSNTKNLNATTVSRYNKRPVFSHDGRQVLFLAGTEWNTGSRPIFSLWSIDVNGTNAKEIADNEIFSDPLKWPSLK